jgi:hypothetical protein
MNKLILLLIALATVTAGRVGAQTADASPRARVPVWVAIAQDLQETEGYRILRFAGNGAGDVILLQPNADAVTFTRAVDALMAIRTRAGDTPQADAAMRVRTSQHRPRGPLPWANRVLRDLRVAELRQVPRVGMRRAVRIWLPAQQP